MLFIRNFTDFKSHIIFYNIHMSYFLFDNQKSQFMAETDLRDSK